MNVSRHSNDKCSNSAHNILSMAFYGQYNTKLIKPLDIYVLFATETVVSSKSIFGRTSK